MEGGQVQVILGPDAAPAAGDVKPGYMGVLLEESLIEDFEAAGPEPGEEEKANRGAGLLRVVDDSPAAKAGLVDGDRVMIYEGTKVKNSAHFRTMVRAGKPEQAVKMTVRREGKDLEIKAKLGATPDNALPFQIGVQDGSAPVPGTVVFYRSLAPAKADRSGGARDLDTVVLRDANRLTGKVQGLAPEQGLTLQREGAPNVELIEAGIEAVHFAAGGKAAPPPRVFMELRDGSSFGGESLTMEAGRMHLMLPSGQKLAVPKNQVQWVTLSNGPAPQTYDGPVSMAGWSGMGRWDYEGGFLRCLGNGSLTRNIERMPDPLDLSFDVVCPPQAQVFNVTLFAGDAEQTAAPGSLTIQFHPQYLQGNHFDGLRFNQYRAAGQPPGEVVAGKVVARRYRLLVDRVNGHALIYVDGVKRADWKFSKIKPEDLGKCGPGLVFMPQLASAGQGFEIGRVRLRPWDGQQPGDAPEPADPKDDQVLTAHAPIRNGRIELITHHEIVLANQSAVPRGENPLCVRFAPPVTAAAELPPAVGWLRLKSGGEFTVAEIHGEGETMTATTCFGAVLVLPSSSLRSFEFFPRANQPGLSAGGSEVMTLTDGTRLKGNLVTPVTGESLRWKIPAAKTALEFPRKLVAGVLLPEARAASETAVLQGPSAVRLGNGDWLPGEIVSLSGGQLVLRNQLSPQLAFPLNSLRSVYVSPAAAASVADGASGPELWSKGWSAGRPALEREQSEALAGPQEAWSYHDGTYSLSAANPRFGVPGLARKWPAYTGAFAVNLEMETAEAAPAFQIQLFNAKDQPTISLFCPGNGRIYFGFNAATDGGNGQRFTNKDFRLPRTSEKKLQLSLVLDRPARAFRVLAAGQEIGRVTFKKEEADAALEVAGINITPQGARRPWRLANLWLAPWAALSDQGTASALPPRTQQVIHLANGDETSGEIEGIDAALLTLNTDVGKLTLPLQRVTLLSFPGPETARPENAVRLRFHDRGVLSVTNLQIEKDRIACQTLQGQRLEFPLALVKELVYQPVF